LSKNYDFCLRILTFVVRIITFVVITKAKAKAKAKAQAQAQVAFLVFNIKYNPFW
jgi:hypothetical protein